MAWDPSEGTRSAPRFSFLRPRFLDPAGCLALLAGDRVDDHRQEQDAGPRGATRRRMPDRMVILQG